MFVIFMAHQLISTHPNDFRSVCVSNQKQLVVNVKLQAHVIHKIFTNADSDIPNVKKRETQYTKNK